MESRTNRREHTPDGVLDVVCVDANHAHAEQLDELAFATPIARFAIVVNAAVDLDHETMTSRVGVDDIGPHWVLPPKSRAKPW